MNFCHLIIRIILNIKLPIIRSANMSSHFMDCLFTLWIVPYNVQDNFAVVQFIDCFLLLSVLLVSYSINHHQIKSHNLNPRLLSSSPGVSLVMKEKQLKIQKPLAGCKVFSCILKALGTLKLQATVSSWRMKTTSLNYSEIRWGKYWKELLFKNINKW